MKIIMTIFVFKDDIKLEKLNKTIENLKGRGISGIRFNFAKFNPEEMMYYALRLRELIESYHNKEFEYFFDIPYPLSKVRIASYTIHDSLIHKGDEYCIVGKEYNNVIQDNFISVGEDFGITKYTGKRIIFGDGEGGFEVIKKNNSILKVIALNSFKIFTNKSLNFEVMKCKYSEIIYKLCNVLSFGKYNYKFILSFIENETDILSFVEQVPQAKGRIVSKIETQDGVDNICKIVKQSEGILIGRGDLCLYAQPEALLENCITISKKVKEEKKELIVATDILKSMKERIVPNRADLIDVANMCKLGCNEFVLSSDFSNIDNLENVIDLLNRINDEYYREGVTLKSLK